MRIGDVELNNHPLVLHWAAKEFQTFNQKQKTGSPRVMLAKLIAKQDVRGVNKHLLSLTPWGNSGTSGALNPNGDYDFTTILLSAILHRFENDTSILWKKTADHIANVLLIEEGGKPHTKTPRTMRIMKDTENHILMVNISQYLKNQWLKERGSTNPEHDNKRNGMEEFLVDLLYEFQKTGPYEFNAKPYEGYTVTAILVLQSYTSSAKLKKLATETLDIMAWEYMLSSYKFRKSSPFRRRLERATRTELDDNAMTSMMKAWYLESQKRQFGVKEIAHNHHQALSALIFDYRPPAEIWVEDDTPRFIQIGHGHNSSPEIYSRGKGWMLCAGGFQRGEPSQIVARPNVLLLDDGATDLNDCFHIKSKGKMELWNNTGVFHRFAVGNGPVHVPVQYQPRATNGDWAIYQHGEQSIVVYSTDERGIIFLPDAILLRDDSEFMQSTFDHWVNVNKNVIENNRFRAYHNGDIYYYPNSKKGTWVIGLTQNGFNVDRDTDSWPRVRVTELP